MTLGGMDAHTPDEREIEITPEMIESGARAIFSFPGAGDGIGFFSPDELARAVYLAMESRRCAVPCSRGSRNLGKRGSHRGTATP